VKTYSINLEGRVKNYSLPKNRPLIPLFEAIVNSLHAIEERKISENKHSGKKYFIEIEIIRSQQPILFSELPAIEGFVVRDNGIGFTEKNMQSFLESDSGYKASIGGKGVGRFSWLKAFSKAEILSIFNENGSYHKRCFEFTLNNQYVNDEFMESQAADDCLTEVKLETYLPDYAQEVPKHIDTVTIKIMQHCLVYFLDIDCPRIDVIDSDQKINLNQLFEDKFKPEENSTYFSLGNYEFQLLNIKITERLFKGNRLYFCANNRMVKSYDLENYIVNLDRQIFEKDGFWYLGILTGKYLDDNTDMNRLSFTIRESGVLFGNDPTIEEIIKFSSVKVQDYLMDYLTKINIEKEQRIKEFATKEAPQYRHLLKHMPDKVSKIKPNISNEKLEEALYGIKREFDKQNKREQISLKEKMNKEDLSLRDYERLLKEQMEKIIDSNQAALADYIMHRKVVIELFDLGIKKFNNDDYSKEAFMHSLIYPMRHNSEDLAYEGHNLWLIDEKLSYCNFISSDEYFDNDPNQERTDIMLLDSPALDSPVFVSEKQNDGTEYNSVIIFELKRPMRNDYNEKSNPITQLQDYVIKIKNGKAKDRFHRPIRVGPTTKFYLYAVCDITQSLQDVLLKMDYSLTPDQIGYYHYHSNLNAYCEVLSYDKILNDAKQRNRVLFDKLGI
jgi:hypothetical protein